MFGIKKFFERTESRAKLGLNNFTHARGLKLTNDSTFAVQVMNLGNMH